MHLMKSPSPYLNKAWVICKGTTNVAIPRLHSCSSQKMEVLNDLICPFSIVGNLKLNNLHRKCKVILGRSSFFEKTLKKSRDFEVRQSSSFYERTSWKHMWFSQLAKVGFLWKNLKWTVFKVEFMWKNLSEMVFKLVQCWVSFKEPHAFLGVGAEGGPDLQKKLSAGLEVGAGYESSENCRVRGEGEGITNWEPSIIYIIV